MGERPLSRLQHWKVWRTQNNRTSCSPCDANRKQIYAQRNVDPTALSIRPKCPFPNQFALLVEPKRASHPFPRQHGGNRRSGVSSSSARIVIHHLRWFFVNDTPLSIIDRSETYSRKMMQLRLQAFESEQSRSRSHTTYGLLEVRIEQPPQQTQVIQNTTARIDVLLQCLQFVRH